MLIKLQESADSLRYLIIENASNVRYETLARHYTNEADFDDGMAREQEKNLGLRHETWTYRETGKPVASNSPVILNFMRFISMDGAEVFLWFDGEAFICNDEGKTIQRVMAAR